MRLSVIGICETKITNEIETLYNIAGYNIFTNNNPSNKGRQTSNCSLGGLALYNKNNIPVMVKLEQTLNRNGVETIFSDLNTPSGIITVGQLATGELAIYHVQEYLIALFRILILIQCCTQVVLS